jgi:hypothetical protein
MTMAEAFPWNEAARYLICDRRLTIPKAGLSAYTFTFG